MANYRVPIPTPPTPWGSGEFARPDMPSPVPAAIAGGAANFMKALLEAQEQKQKMALGQEDLDIKRMQKKQTAKGGAGEWQGSLKFMNIAARKQAQEETDATLGIVRDKMTGAIISSLKPFSEQEYNDTINTKTNELMSNWMVPALEKFKTTYTTEAMKKKGQGDIDAAIQSYLDAAGAVSDSKAIMQFKKQNPTLNTAETIYADWDKAVATPGSKVAKRPKE